MAQGGLVAIPPDFVPLEHVQRALKNADCRTPIIFFLEDGDPFLSLCKIARDTDSAVWHFDLALMKSVENAMDYIDVGSKNGDWVFITRCDGVEPNLFREISRKVFLLTPDPKKFPRREFFRCFFSVEKRFNVEMNVGAPFPPILLKNSIIAQKNGEHNGKWSIKLPSEAHFREQELSKRITRRKEGRDSDSETDLDEDDKLSGMWFHRSVELNKASDGSPIILAEEQLMNALEDEDTDTIKKLVQNGEIDLARETKSGMTPLQYTCSREKVKASICLLECGADPNLCRRSDGRPPMFMAIDDVRLARALIEHGADLYAKYQGYRVESHPDTSPEVAKLVKKMRESI